MSILCSICRDVISYVNFDKILGLTCGHIFHSTCLRDWMARSHTCPHCRRILKAGDVHRVYLEVSQDLPTEDPAVLTANWDSALFELKLKTEELQVSQNIVDTLRQQNSTLRAEIVTSEEKLGQAESNSVRLSSELRSMQKNVRALQAKNDNITRKLNRYAGVEMVLEGSAAEAERELNLNSQLNRESVNLCAVSFKRDLAAAVKREGTLREQVQLKCSELTSALKENERLHDHLSVAERVIESLKKQLTTPNMRTTPTRNNKKRPAMSPLTDIMNSTTFEVIASGKEKRSRLAQNAPKDKTPSSSATTRSRNLLVLRPPTNMAVAGPSTEAYDGLGGRSKPDDFPKARLKICNIVNRRRKQ